MVVPSRPDQSHAGENAKRGSQTRDMHATHANTRTSDLDSDGNCFQSCTTLTSGDSIAQVHAARQLKAVPFLDVLTSSHECFATALASCRCIFVLVQGRFSIHLKTAHADSPRHRNRNVMRVRARPVPKKEVATFGSFPPLLFPLLELLLGPLSCS